MVPSVLCFSAQWLIFWVQIAWMRKLDVSFFGSHFKKKWPTELEVNRQDSTEAPKKGSKRRWNQWDQWEMVSEKDARLPTSTEQNRKEQNLEKKLERPPKKGLECRCLVALIYLYLLIIGCQVVAQNGCICVPVSLSYNCFSTRGRGPSAWFVYFGQNIYNNKHLFWPTMLFFRLTNWFWARKCPCRCVSEGVQPWSNCRVPWWDENNP